MRRVVPETVNNSGFTSYDADYDYEADNAEAVVYMISESGKLPKPAVYVMSRSDAVKFCSRKETAGQGCGGKWAFVFTTHKPDWRDTPEIFRKDDGRFNELLREMGIKVIYPCGENCKTRVVPARPDSVVQLSLF